MEAANHIAEDIFQCTNCSFKENYHYYGKQPPFSNKIKLKEDSYVMKDPFSLPNKCRIFILGSNCSVCSKVTCSSLKCSIFFTKRFCHQCIRNNIYDFPTEIQTKFLQS